jgi:S1-C subfamily serine protease
MSDLTRIAATRSLLQDLNQDLADLAERVRSSLVFVQSRRGNGAGLVWDDSGLILTSAHVARRGPLMLTSLAGDSASAKVVGSNEESDLALVRGSIAKVSPIDRGLSSQLRPGDWVLAIGNPWGVPGAATAGIVIAVEPHRDESGRHMPAVVVADLHLRPGHSGGPLVDSHGRLVGISTLANGPDVGVAVAVEEAEALHHRLFTN